MSDYQSVDTTLAEDDARTDTPLYRHEENTMPQSSLTPSTFEKSTRATYPQMLPLYEDAFK